MLVIHIALDMKVAVHADGPVIAKFKKAAALMNEPEFSAGRCRWGLIVRKASSNDDALFYVALLGDKKHLITRIGWADHSPSAADPLRQHRQPTG